MPHLIPDKGVLDPDPIMLQTIGWSREVDENIARIVRGVTPFPGVREAFSKFMEFADIVIVSATPHEAIVREWGEHDLLKYLTEVAGQELGTKAECIRKANSGHYAPDHILMIGDALGDYAAAQQNGVLYYPIIPGSEVQSWEDAKNVIADQLKNGTYEGESMDNYLEAFNKVLLKDPVWQVK